MASHTREHTHTRTFSLSLTGDAHTQTLGCCISVMSEPKLLRSQAEALGCGSLLSAVRFSLGCTCLPPVFFLTVLFTLLNSSLFFPPPLFALFFLSFSQPSLLSSASLLLLVSPLSVLLVLHLTERQTETDAFVGDRICVCVRALPPQIDSSATCAQLQLPTDGGGIRDGRVTGRGREKERKEWERWRETNREEGRGRIKCWWEKKGKSGWLCGG